MKQLKLLLCGLLALSLLGSGYAAGTFDNESGDFLWSNPINWDDDTLPSAQALINTDHCILNTTANLTGAWVIVDTELQIDGGTLTTPGALYPGYNTNGKIVVKNGGTLSGSSATIGVLGGVSGTIQIDSGTVTTGHTFVGSGNGGNGTVQMNGGIYDCGASFRVGWGAPPGQVNVDDGQIQVAGAGGFWLLVGGGSNVDLEDGTLLIENTDWTGFAALYASDGRLTAFDGTGVIQSSYDGTDTLVWAVPEPATMALLVLGGLMIRRKRP